MDSENSAFEAPQAGIARGPIRASGCRRVTLDMRAWCDRADSFKGLPRGTAKPFTFLAAFKEAEPQLALPTHAYKLVDWLVRLTKPQDWEEGSRPIAWPALRRQVEFLGLSERRVQALNRVLQEAGIFVMRDDPQGRRYGHRDKNGHITKGFGFDLSLLATRHEEFKKIAAAAQIERNRMKKLKAQTTLVRKAIGQAAEELGRQGCDSEALQRLLQEAAELVKAAALCERSDELTVAVKALERRKDEIEQMLRELVKPVETTPMGDENDTHSTTTTLIANDIYHTVNRSRGCSQVEAPTVPKDQAPSKPQGLFPESLQITPATLVEIAPRLAPYVPARTSDKSWPAIVDAALYLSAEMGINRTLWARACEVMGREYAAVAMAIVSTRPEGHFTSGPGGYFAGMLRKFEKNPQDLCLARTLWKLKDEAWGKEGHKERRQLAKASLRSSSRMTLVGRIAPAGTLPRQAVRPVLPAPRANSAPVDSAKLAGYSDDRQLDHDVLELKGRVDAMFANPKNGTSTTEGPEMPRDEKR